MTDTALTADAAETMLIEEDLDADETDLLAEAEEEAPEEEDEDDDEEDDEEEEEEADVEGEEL